MKKIRVKNHEGKELIVQEALIPRGYQYVEEVKPKKKKKSNKK